MLRSLALLAWEEEKEKEEKDGYGTHTVRPHHPTAAAAFLTVLP